MHATLPKWRISGFESRLPHQPTTKGLILTCIVAVKDGKTIYMGADSAGSGGGYTESRKDPKVWVDGEFIYGFTSSFRMGAILRYHFKPPRRGKLSVDAYMNTRYVDELMQTLSDNWWIEDKTAKAEGGTFIVGYAGRIFCVQSDFQVGETRDKYYSVGSGSWHALGSLFSTEGLLQSPEQRVKIALRASAKFTTTVEPPFKIVKLENK